MPVAIDGDDPLGKEEAPIEQEEQEKTINRQHILAAKAVKRGQIIPHFYCLAICPAGTFVCFLKGEAMSLSR